MDREPILLQELVTRVSLHPRRDRFARRFANTCRAVGIIAIALHHGIRQMTVHTQWELGLIIVAAMSGIAVSQACRHHWSLAQHSYLSTHRIVLSGIAIWLCGLVVHVSLGPFSSVHIPGAQLWDDVVGWTELMLLFQVLVGAVRAVRRLAAGGLNPAVLLVASFALLVMVGTFLLMLPRARVQDAGPQTTLRAPFTTALFTATSASCVTGLIVEDTGTYWSRSGQTVILCLFQIGGLGIMTFSGFFAIAAGRSVGVKEHNTLRELLDSEESINLKRMFLAILSFTLIAELLGALLLSGLWPDSSWSERAYQSVFHAVSAFCNAGFAMTQNSFVGMAHRPEVWGVVAILIIVGGLGFAVLANLFYLVCDRVRQIVDRRGWETPEAPFRLPIGSWLVLITTAVLLIGGTIGFAVFERLDPKHDSGISLADAWFQSVTMRTAGFNTLDLGDLQPSSKLFAILLMFIGASPGSTGGGVKTAVFAIAVLGVWTILRGRRNLEFMGRQIPYDLVNRAMAIMFLAMAGIITTTMLLIIFEQQPQRFVDHLFEATSAMGTVGVSTSVELASGEIVSTTRSLSTSSRLVICVAMFLGRVGPLTLLLALGGRSTEDRYQYPLARVTLG